MVLSLMSHLVRLVFSSSLALTLTVFAYAQASTWKIDPAHAAAEFSIRHMGLSNVHGQFGGVNGEIVLDPANLSKASVKATVDVTTVDTGVADRDKHLKSADFFDVAKYPTMTFVSKSIAKSADGYAVTGDLTMHGVTKEVVLHLDPPAKEQSIGPQTRRGFDATTTIHRQDFGLNWNGTMKSGDAMLGNDVKVTLDLEAVKQ
jgi:polyisoprenoid-binding protein YceI